jgi:hypothetical protein
MHVLDARAKPLVVENHALIDLTGPDLAVGKTASIRLDNDGHPNAGEPLNDKLGATCQRRPTDEFAR